MQWVSELTVPGQLSTIERRGTVWGTHGNAAKSASCSINSAGPEQMRPPNHPHKRDCLGLPAGLDGTVNSLTFFKNISYLNC
jgi:hypothetical protein